MEQYLDILYDSMLKRRERQKKFMVSVSKRASHLNPAQPLEIVPQTTTHIDDDEEEEDDDDEDGPKNKLILNKNVWFFLVVKYFFLSFKENYFF